LWQEGDPFSALPEVPLSKRTMARRIPSQASWRRDRRAAIVGGGDHEQWIRCSLKLGQRLDAIPRFDGVGDSAALSKLVCQPGSAHARRWTLVWPGSSAMCNHSSTSVSSLRPRFLFKHPSLQGPPASSALASTACRWMPKPRYPTALAIDLFFFGSWLGLSVLPLCGALCYALLARGV
jgi:hypothetical protein